MALVSSDFHMGFWCVTSIARLVQQSPLPIGLSICPLQQQLNRWLHLHVQLPPEATVD